MAYHTFNSLRHRYTTIIHPQTSSILSFPTQSKWIYSFYYCILDLDSKLFIFTFGQCAYIVSKYNMAYLWRIKIIVVCCLLYHDVTVYVNSDSTHNNDGFSLNNVDGVQMILLQCNCFDLPNEASRLLSINLERRTTLRGDSGSHMIASLFPQGKCCLSDMINVKKSHTSGHVKQYT